MTDRALSFPGVSDAYAQNVLAVFGTLTDDTLTIDIAAPYPAGWIIGRTNYLNDDDVSTDADTTHYEFPVTGADEWRIYLYFDGTYDPTVTGSGTFSTAVNEDVRVSVQVPYPEDDVTISPYEPSSLAIRQNTTWLVLDGPGGFVEVDPAAGTLFLVAPQDPGDVFYIFYLDPSVVPPYDPPPPAEALVEIYAAVPGSARWGLAHWAEDVWSSAAWQDVTPESVTARILWGSNRPELGILSQPDAGSWAITTYDPDRLLDPSNLSSPYAADLIPGLPVRITHRGLVIRQGTVESIGYAFRYREHTGYLRVTDNIARLANADVPDDSTLPDTMWARARAAITAAGVAVTVLPDPPSGDPALVPWVTGTQQSAWDWISDAARQCLSIPYIDNIGRLGFRLWSVPLNRARNFTSPELVELDAISSYDGLYSRVQAREDPDGPVTERGFTPTPRYGKRTYARTDPVLDAGAWAQAVLDDRALPRIRWAPSDLYPSTADAVERLATIAAVELVGIRVDEADPQILADAIVVGGEINLTGKRGSSALWRFGFEATAVAPQPLGVDAADPPEFLYLSDGSDYLYPD